MVPPPGSGPQHLWWRSTTWHTTPRDHQRACASRTSRTREAIAGEHARSCRFTRSRGPDGGLVIMASVSAVLTWILWGYALLALVIIGSAAFVAVFVPDGSQRRDAYKVLKLMLGALTTGGFLALLVKLHEAGLL